MDFNIITGYPTWYILLCILAGILGSMILYFRENKSEFPTWLKRLLGVIRFLMISMIAFLLMSPLLRLSSHNIEKPVIIIVQDNSMSMVLNEDSAFYRQEYPAMINRIAVSLEDDFEVRSFTYGEEVESMNLATFDTLTYHEHETDISAVFDMMDARFVNRNIGALIIAGDGIYNKGFNPLYYAEKVSYPIYTLALGDTSERRDAFLKRVLYNRIAFQGNDFPVEIILNARKMPGTTLTLSVSEGGTRIHSEQLRVNGNNFSSTINFSLPAEDAGTHHYLIRLSSGQDEVTMENNRYDLFVDVLQSKQKILILSNAPHPDISAIKEAIKTNINYEVDDMILDDFTGPLEAYSLVILHQLPSYSPVSSSLFSRLGRAKVPMLLILGEQSDLRFFNELKAGMQTNSVHRTGMIEVFPVLNESFNTFNVSKELADLIPLLPPLNVPFNRYTAANSARILFTQKIGDIESPDPLWILQGASEVKTGVITGTGIWRWKIKSWLITGDHLAFSELISKTVQFLAMKDDKRKFRVSARQRFPENTPVSFEAELYNDTYEPFNEPDVNIEILDEEGNAYDYVFSRTGDGYTLNTGGLGVGRYTYRANTRNGDQVLSDQGGFVITPVVAEQSSLRAAHDMLEELAKMKNGRMLRLEEVDSLPEILKQRGDVKPLIHAEKKYIEFIDVWWMLLVILSLLGLEWFLRKWSGSY